METSFYRNYKVCHLAIHLLLRANHKAQKMVWNGKEEIIERGQILTGLHTLSQETGLSIQSVRTGLSILSAPTIGFLTIKSTNKFSVISIVKYEDYQINDNKQTNKQTTNKQQTNNKQVTTNNNDNNDNNDKSISSTTTIKGEEKKKFIPPTLQDIADYVKSNNISIDPDHFFHYYESNGWKVGRNPMKNWKAAIRTWVIKQREGYTKKPQPIDYDRLEAQRNAQLYWEEKRRERLEEEGKDVSKSD